MTEPQGAGRWLVPDWRWVLQYAWSIKLIILAAFLSAFEVVLAVFSNDPPIPHGVFAALSGFVTLAAFIVRFIAQGKP